MATVLVVSREEAIVAWLKSYLETVGFRVMTATAGCKSYSRRVRVCFDRIAMMK